MKILTVLYIIAGSFLSKASEPMDSNTITDHSFSLDSLDSLEPDILDVDVSGLSITSIMDIDDYSFTKADLEKAIIEAFQSGQRPKFLPRNNVEIGAIQDLIRKAQTDDALKGLKEASPQTRNFILAWSFVHKQWDITNALLNRRKWKKLKKDQKPDTTVLKIMMSHLPDALKESIKGKLKHEL